MEFFKGEIIETLDGSKSLKHHLLQDTYHSKSGALQESEYIYIECGLKNCPKQDIKIFEMGLGTGLNMLLTIDYALKNNKKVEYHTVELYPLALELIEAMDFSKFCSQRGYEIFIEAHKCPWNSSKAIEIDPSFAIKKYCCDIENLEDFPTNISVVYYDAFAPDTQSYLWSSKIFTSLYNSMSSGAQLVTYSSKGDVKRALRESGFEVKRLHGVGGKRHIVRATKLQETSPLNLENS